jgi:hypothetical protein
MNDSVSVDMAEQSTQSDPLATDCALAQLPWPHVTEARLRKVLKARDKVVK